MEHNLRTAKILANLTSLERVRYRQAYDEYRAARETDDPNRKKYWANTICDLEAKAMKRGNGFLAPYVNNEENTMSEDRIIRIVPKQVAQVQYQKFEYDNNEVNIVVAGTKTYSFGIPNDLVVAEGDYVIMPDARGDSITLGKVKEIKSVVDDTWEETYKFIIGRVSADFFDMYINMYTNAKKRARILKLIEQEKQAMVNTLDLTKLAELSPNVAALIEQLKEIK